MTTFGPPPTGTSLLAYAPFFPNGVVNDAWSAWFTSLTEVIVAGPVQSFNGRTGVIVPQSGDYEVSQITGSSHTWAYKASTTTGLTLGIYGGPAWNGTTYTSVGDTTVALTASSTNYVERTVAGAVSANTSAWTAGRLPLYLVTTSGSVVTGIVDQRGASTTVQSVFGRSGAVVATTGDYGVAQVTGAAPLASPTFTGTVTGPTITASTQFSGPGTGLTGTAASLTAGTATTATVANGLKSATTTVSVSAATAPTNGQVLTATSSTTATWQTPSGGAAPYTGNVQTTNPSNPTALTGTNTTAQMAGLAVAFTPAVSTRVLIVIEGWAANSQAQIVSTTIRTGTGTAPANGVSVTGTQRGGVNASNASTTRYFFSISAVATGLTVGTPIWIDLACTAALASSSVSYTNLNVTITEI